ncbi:hypothetical protein [Streptomyces bluensis]|uniref:hypothetical protein n=1 Tax=Streptomyces bluensis TaxID=33897 RepID=UPI0033301637
MGHSDDRFLVTVDFTETVHAHELASGDVFTFPEAAHTPLTIHGVIKQTFLSHELSILAFPVPGRAEPLHLTTNTLVRPHRMVRTFTLRCLLCGKSEDIELDLPRDGRPLSFVCGDHARDTGQSTEGA